MENTETRNLYLLLLLGLSLGAILIFDALPSEQAIVVYKVLRGLLLPVLIVTFFVLAVWFALNREWGALLVSQVILLALLGVQKLAPRELPLQESVQISNPLAPGQPRE